jgi:hypothetical protein
MSNDHTLGLSGVTVTIHTPIEKVDIPDWLFNLPDAKYQRCGSQNKKQRVPKVLSSSTPNNT